MMEDVYKKATRAENYFKSGYNCAQSVLLAFAEDCGIDEKTVAKLAGGFGGGMGEGEICGAVTGAYMVLGLKYGPENAFDHENKENIKAKRSMFQQEFRRYYGSLRCKDILGCDLATEEGRLAANQNMLFDKVCPEVVRTSAKILENIFNNHSPDNK